MPGWEALLEEHFQGRDVRPARREERPLHRDFAGVDAVGPLSLRFCRGPLLPEIVLLLDLPRPGEDGGGTGRGILRGGVCCLPRVG